MEMGFKLWLREAQFSSGAFSRTGRNEVFGWLTSRGNFYPANRFEHLESIGKYSELKNLVSDFDEKWKELENAKEVRLGLVDKGQHPEWHGYELNRDTLENIVVRSLYLKGCLRVASVGKTMYFEGLPNAIKSLYQKARDLAEEYGMGTNFHPLTRNEMPV